MNTRLQTLDPIGTLPSSNWSQNLPLMPLSRRPGRHTVWLALVVGMLLSLFATTSARAERIPANCNGSGLGINLFTSIPDVHIGDTLFYSVNVFNGIPNSGRIVCDAENITAFIVTPDNVSHPVTLVRTYLHQGENDFYPDVVSYVVRAQDIQPDGTLLATARDTGTIHQNDTDSIGGGFQGVNTEVNIPCIKITALCVGGVGENGLITFTGTVTNCGNNTLVGVTVTNFHDLGNFTVLFPTNLAIGQTANFSGSFLPGNPCIPSTATLTVRASDEFTSTPRAVTNFTTITCQNTLTPGIKVTKVCPVSPVSPGQLLTFSGSVSNSGNITLTNIVVLDNQPAPNTPVFNLASLAPGAVANFTGSYLAPTACSVSDTLTATAASRCGVGVSSVASATCPILTTPQIAVTATCPVTPVLPGGSLVYSGTVRNTGNITLNNAAVVSDRPAANTTVFTVASLAPGASANFTTTVTVPANACAVATTFTGSGNDSCTAVAVSNTVTTTCPVTTAPAIVVTLACPATQATPGATITYSGTVRNSGNVTLNNVFVVNNQPAFNTAVIGPITLAPGATANFTTSFTAPGDGCSVSSTVNATGNDNCTGSPVSNSASATCPLTTAPGIVITQLCPVSPGIPGSPVTYSGTVRNSGNVTLTNIIVLNSLSGATPVFTATTLAPGAIANFTGSYIATTNCSATSTSTATGRSVCGVNVSNAVTTTCAIVSSPQIAVTATCPATPVLPGGSFTYNGTVRNTGNTPLVNVVVVSDRPAANTTVFTVASLAPGVTANFTGTYTVPANACAVATTFSGTGQDTCTAASVVNSVTTTCTVTTAPGIVVTLACPAVAATAGGSITYTGTVRNSGNVTLNNVFVVNNQPAFNTPVIGPITIAPGATVNFNATFTAPIDTCTVSSTVVATGNDNCTAAPVSSTASATCSLVTTPGLVLTQNCPVGPLVPGAVLTYNGTVRNSGNVTLTNIIILNNLSGSTPVFTATTLAPGVTANFTGSYLAPTNCSSTSTSTGTARSICGVAVTGLVSATCTIQTAPQIVLTAICPVGTVTPGSSLTYSGTIRNAGNITLNNVVVLSDRPSANTTVFTVASLAPGATANFTSSVTVPANACAVTTTFSSIGNDSCSLSSVTNTVTTTCNVTTAPGIVVTLQCPSAVSATAGGPLVQTATVRNSGNVTLNNVLVVISHPAFTGTVLGPITLAPGAFVNFNASSTAPADACSVLTTATATGNDSCSNLPVSNSTSVTCALLTTPSIVVTQTCPVGPTTPGSVLTYSGTVRNAGNITLTNIVVLNNLSGASPVFTTGTLAPGAIANFTGSYLAPTNCSSTSTSTATGRSTCGVAVSGLASSTCTIVTSPQIVLTANCPVTPVLPGGSFTYSGTVRNNGNITLNNVVVVSDRPAANTTVFTVASLAPGAVANFSSTLTVPANACSVTTTFSSVGLDSCSSTMVTNTVTTTCTVTTAPAIAVTLACPVISASTGGAITYTGTVRNSGNVTLNNVFVVNNQPGPNTAVIGPITLAAGATANFNATFTAPFDACAVTSTVIATGNDNCTAALVSNTASATCTLVTTPGIVITQDCPVSPAIPGSPLIYSGTVRNSGNITLTNVVVVNNQSGANPVFTIATLSPGAVVGFTGSYLTPTGCSTASTSTVTGRSICGTAVTSSASATCPILTTPAIVVTQTCPVIPVLPGGILTYSGTVSNAGNITLTNIIVLNNLPATNTVVFTLATLAPGATAPFTGSYQVPTNCCVVSSMVRASGQACLGVTVTDTATRTCIVSTSPKIVVTKICVPGLLRAGDLLTYGGSVSNAGNIALINVTVMNNQTPGIPVLGPIVLAPGESVTYNASYIVPPDFCGNDTVTASGMDVCTFLPVSNSVNTTCPVTTAPRITVIKNCPLLPTPRGGLYTFTGSVSNPGNVTLVNVFVVDNQPTNNTPVIGPITLAPGATVNFSGSYIAPHCCCLIIDTLTARGQDRCSSATVTSTSTTVCPLLTTPGITLIQSCPLNPIPMGSVYSFAGRVSNSGDVVLTNVFVFGPQGTALLGPIELAPGESEAYSGSYTVPFNTCSVAVTAQGRDVCAGSLTTTATSCPVATTPAIAVTENCPPGPVASGSSVTYNGLVSNVGNVSLTNVMVFRNVSGNLTQILGPITLAPGASAPYSGSYTATSGSNQATNSGVVTFTPTNTVTATGVEFCQSRTVAAAANCLGPVAPTTVVAVNGAPTVSNGSFTLSFPSVNGTTYILQFKNSLSDPAWTDLQTIVGTGGNIPISDSTVAQQQARFYRIVTQ